MLIDLITLSDLRTIRECIALFERVLRRKLDMKQTIYLGIS